MWNVSFFFEGETIDDFQLIFISHCFSFFFKSRGRVEEPIQIWIVTRAQLLLCLLPLYSQSGNIKPLIYIPTTANWMLKKSQEEQHFLNAFNSTRHRNGPFQRTDILCML